MQESSHAIHALVRHLSSVQTHDGIVPRFACGFRPRWVLQMSDDRLMNCVHIVGRKNHGKTTLIVELTEEFVRRGLGIGSVKHSTHPHELDHPGKDSHRHRLAGACPAAIATEDLVAVFQPRRNNDFYRQIAPMFGHCDLVLVEGDIDGPGTKLEVWRQLARDRRDITAAISDDQPDADIPIWPRSDIALLADRFLATTNSHLTTTLTTVPRFPCPANAPRWTTSPPGSPIHPIHDGTPGSYPFARGRKHKVLPRLCPVVFAENQATQVTRKDCRKLLNSHAAACGPFAPDRTAVVGLDVASGELTQVRAIRKRQLDSCVFRSIGMLASSVRCVMLRGDMFRTICKHVSTASTGFS